MARKPSKPSSNRKRRRTRLIVSPQTLLRLTPRRESAPPLIEIRSTHARSEREHTARAGHGAALVQAVSEYTRCSALSILALAERRITGVELDQLNRYVEQESEYKTVRESLVFLSKFWGVILRATRNHVLQRQVHLAMRRRLELERCHGIGLETDDRILSKEPYRYLIHLLRRGYGAPAFWARRLEDLAQQPHT